MNLKASPGRPAISLDSLPPFKNTPPTDFAVEKNREAFAKAIELVRGQLGREYPLIIGGDEMRAASSFESRNPAKPSEVIGKFQAASAIEAEIAVEQASKAFALWSEKSAAERAACLIEAARLMRERRHMFSAWMVLEVGKTWTEADADTAEAVDFLEFYAREMLRLDGPQSVEQLVGERSALLYLPLGVGAVIPPWNFPLAITTGMASAAIVAGNTVVLKPSSDAPAIALQFFRLMEEAGLPPGVLNLLTGSGSQAGDALVTNPRVRFVAFTGSRAVGVDIYRKAAEVRGG
ncbi:MAG: aldehyde dehydrogenase family protein, partial [Chloroflexi bacterium]|nr:aldehyde dehydrogenase family protein [Chloroflexota bacterium]